MQLCATSVECLVDGDVCEPVPDPAPFFPPDGALCGPAAVGDAAEAGALDAGTADAGDAAEASVDAGTLAAN